MIVVVVFVVVVVVVAVAAAAAAVILLDSVRLLVWCAKTSTLLGNLLLL
jgi:hypothetical protein